MEEREKKREYRRISSKREREGREKVKSVCVCVCERERERSKRDLEREIRRVRDSVSQ